MSSIIPDYMNALEMELEERISYLKGEELETIYIGGGTPSLLQTGQLKRLFNRIEHFYKLAPGCEITIEANPDDLSTDYLLALFELTPVNRLSIGIQSFNDNDLILLNRRHTARQAILCINESRKVGFTNITIDLIYGLPGMDVSSWKRNLDIAFSLDIQHLSAYHLTVEPDTAFARMAARGLIHLPHEDESSKQFLLLNSLSTEKGFSHYEISNLAKEGYMSKHNCNYWRQRKYLGVGPSAHSYDLVTRQWNMAHVKKYMEAVLKGNPYAESEVLDMKTRFNEYLMLSLRTRWGIDMSVIVRNYGEQYAVAFEKNLQPLLSSEWIILGDDSLCLTTSGWLVSDYIVGRLIV